MKRVLTILIAVTLLLGTTACSATQSGTANSQSSNTATTEQKTGTIAQETDKETEEATTKTVEVDPVGPGNYIEDEGLKISFLTATQYSKISSGERYGYEDKPDKGKVFLVFTFEFENKGSEKINVSSMYFSAYCDDYDVDDTYISNAPNELERLSGDIGKGKKVKGYVAYQVDKDWKNFEMTYDDGLSDDSQLKFIVTPDTITKK